MFVADPRRVLAAMSLKLLHFNLKQCCLTLELIRNGECYLRSPIWKQKMQATNTLRYDFEYLGFDDSDGDEEVKFSY